jgi:hypothetical protein
MDGLPIIPQPESRIAMGDSIKIDRFAASGGAISVVAALASRQNLHF